MESSRCLLSDWSNFAFSLWRQISILREMTILQPVSSWFLLNSICFFIIHFPIVKDIIQYFQEIKDLIHFQILVGMIQGYLIINFSSKKKTECYHFEKLAEPFVLSSLVPYHFGRFHTVMTFIIAFFKSLWWIQMGGMCILVCISNFVGSLCYGF